MSHAFPLPTSSSCGHRLGPARVVGVIGTSLRVQLEGGADRRARLAVAFPYRPEVGDTVLVFGDAEEAYVIGVLHGQGATHLEFSGDVELRSRHGSVRLRGEEGVHIEGPTVEVRTGKLDIVAKAAVQTLDWLSQRIRETWTVHAGQSHHVVAETATTHAKNARIVTEGKVKINGEAIHLG